MTARAIEVKFQPGMEPEPDETNQKTRHIIDGNNIRFWRGGVEKIGGHVKEVLSFVDLEGTSLSSITAYDGVPRAVMSFADSSNRAWTIIGTHKKLYAKFGSTVYNITPLVTTATATLGTNPLDVTSGDATMTVAYTAHGLAVGDRIRLSGATDTGGVTAATYINKQHIVATVPDADSFTVELGATAGSTATGGGAAVDIYKQIANGEADAVNVSGYGIGTYGTGTYNSSQTDTTLFIQPRVWWMDAWGDNWVGGTGQAGKCYEWAGDVDTAPTIISNAPNADWGWVEDVKLVVISANNTIANSDTGDYTDWTAPVVGSSAYSDVKEDARKLITRVAAGSTNLICADENKVFSLRWVGGTAKWEWRLISSSVGICSPYGGININGIAYIFAKDGVYWFNGVSLEPLPANSILRYVFDDMNTDQRYKFFVWFNQKYHELHGNYVSANATENDREWYFNLKERHWTKRTGIDRTAADFAGQVLGYPVLASSDGYTYQHEYGYNDDSAAMDAWAQVAYAAISNGDYYTDISGMSPDLIQTGTMTVDLYGKHDAVDSGVLLESFSMPAGTTELNGQHETCWRSWKFRSNAVDGYFRLGGMKELIARGSEA